MSYWDWIGFGLFVCLILVFDVEQFVGWIGEELEVLLGEVVEWFVG